MEKLMKLTNNHAADEMHTSELLVPEPWINDTESIIENLNCYKSSNTSSVLMKIIQADGKTVNSHIHKLQVCILNRNNYHSYEMAYYCSYL
jgi:hypothetical protein